jgi:hypothetical protein
LPSNLHITTHSTIMLPSKSCLRVEGRLSISLDQTKRSVAFRNIEIAEYPVQVGDNPVAEGVPISIGWECDSKEVFDFEEYESFKVEPRTKYELLMPPHMRRDILKRQGFTANEMRLAVIDGKKIKKSRNKSIKNQKWDGLHLFIEKSQRTLKKVTSLTLMSSSPSEEEASFEVTKSNSSPSFYDDNDEASNPLDNSHHRLAMHLLRHPEELDIEEEDEEEMYELSSQGTSTPTSVDEEEPLCF